MNNLHAIHKLLISPVYNNTVFRWSRTILGYMFYPPQYTPQANEKGSDFPVLFRVFILIFSVYFPFLRAKIAMSIHCQFIAPALYLPASNLRQGAERPEEL